jgi:hypothetical protein
VFKDAKNKKIADVLAEKNKHRSMMDDEDEDKSLIPRIEAAKKKRHEINAEKEKVDEMVRAKVEEKKQNPYDTMSREDFLKDQMKKSGIDLTKIETPEERKRKLQTIGYLKPFTNTKDKEVKKSEPDSMWSKLTQNTSKVVPFEGGRNKKTKKQKRRRASRRARR